MNKVIIKNSEHSSAIFSPDEKYRYFLRRQLSDKPGTVNFIMLNPSTADENVNDPTVARCCNYTKQWGFGSIIVTNIFALRSTDPKGLRETDDPTGDLNC